MCMMCRGSLLQDTSLKTLVCQICKNSTTVFSSALHCAFVAAKCHSQPALYRTTTRSHSLLAKSQFKNIVQHNLSNPGNWLRVCYKGSISSGARGGGKGGGGLPSSLSLLALRGGTTGASSMSALCGGTTGAS